MTKTYEAVFMRPHTAFHLGEKGIGLEESAQVIHADTLFSALCNVWVRCHGRSDLEDLLSAFREGAPPFLLSSAFPCAWGIPFFPKPAGRFRLPEGEDVKKLKDMDFVSRGILEKILNDEELTDSAWLQGNLWLTKEEAKIIVEAAERSANQRLEPDALRFWAVQEVPRVRLDRTTHASEIFYFSRVVFSEGCGFLFLIRYLDEAWRDKLATVVRVLGDTGIGGDRTVGYGLFEPVLEQVSLRMPEEAPHFATLSLLSPCREDIQKGLLDGDVAYNLVVRDGWIFSPDARAYRRRSVRMFGEGSIFAGGAETSYGRLVDVSPTEPEVRLSHPIYRYGYAFPVPIVMVGREEEA